METIRSISFESHSDSFEIDFVVRRRAPETGGKRRRITESKAKKTTPNKTTLFFFLAFRDILTPFEFRDL